MLVRHWFVNWTVNWQWSWKKELLQRQQAVAEGKGGRVRETMMDPRYLRGKRARVAEIGEVQQAEGIHTLEGTTQRAQMDPRREAQESTLEKQHTVITMVAARDQKSSEAGEHRLLRQVGCSAPGQVAQSRGFFSTVTVQYHSVSHRTRPKKKGRQVKMAEDMSE